MKYYGKITDDHDLVTKEFTETAISTAGDTKITDPSTKSDGQLLQWDQTNNKWVAADAPASGVTSVTAADSTITIGGTAAQPTVAVGSLNASKITEGTFADARIASASTWNAKQDALVSGTNIKTINSTSILGSGDIPITGGVWGQITGTLSAQTDLNTALAAKQDKLYNYILESGD